MSIPITCPGCGKSLRVKDEWAGKRAKCPGCGGAIPIPMPRPARAQEEAEEIITPAAYTPSGAGSSIGSAASKPAPAASPAPAPKGRAAGTAFNPGAAATIQQRNKSGPAVSVNWGLIFMGLGLVCVLVLIGLFLTGPKKVWGEWEKIDEQARYDVTDVVQFGLECHLSEEGMYNPRKAQGQPQVTDVTFFRPGFVMSMPDSVDLKGTTNEGPFTGQYHPKTGEVAVNMEVGGGAHIPGTGGKVKTGYTIHITGRRKNGKLTAEVNGKTAVLHYPPPDEDQ